MDFISIMRDYKKGVVMELSGRSQTLSVEEIEGWDKRRGNGGLVILRAAIRWKDVEGCYFMPFAIA